MLNRELKNKLEETLGICEIHHQRMMFAYNNVKKQFPLTETGFGSISGMELALFDQLIYRFSKLQDSMGTRLFKQLLEALEEDVAGLPFIDILHKLEQIKLLDDAKDWIRLRQIRNIVTHEYPFFKEMQIEELNLLPIEVQKLSDIWKKLHEFTIRLLHSNF